MSNFNIISNWIDLLQSYEMLLAFLNNKNFNNQYKSYINKELINIVRTILILTNFH